MLSPRICTAVILGLFVVGGIIFLPPWIMQAFFTVFIFAGAMEWAALSGAKSSALRVAYGLGTIAITIALYQVLRHRAEEHVLLFVACGWWMVASVLIVHYQIKGTPRLNNGAGLALLGWLIFVPAWSAVIILLERWPEMLLALLAMVWSADTLAYFGGKALGRRRLASRISPGKTWEGMLIALFGTLALAVVVAVVLKLAPLLVVLLIVSATVIASVIGDLLESLLKRCRGVKDSGSILPGHGGILDRIDSILAAAPVFTLGFISAGQ